MPVKHETVSSQRVFSATTLEKSEMAWAVLNEIPDPEIPVISIVDLGIVRDVSAKNSAVSVTITPTYSGCPAMAAIREDIESRLKDAGFTEVLVVTVLAPAWSTDFISPAGREKMRAFGIVPPGANPQKGTSIHAGHSRAVRFMQNVIPCPRCGSSDTEKLAEFASTACKALHRCRACGEPFDYFKPL